MGIRTKLLAIFTGLLVLVFVGKASAGSLLTIGSAQVSPGDQITVPVEILGVTDLYAFQFDVSFNPSIISAVSITEGPFLPSAGPTFFIPGTIDNGVGVVSFTADTLLGNIPGASGSGALAFLTLVADAPGTSPLSLSNAILLDSNLGDISFTTQDGQVIVNNVPEPSTLSVLAVGLVGIAFLCLRSPISRARPH